MLLWIMGIALGLLVKYAAFADRNKKCMLTIVMGYIAIAIIFSPDFVIYERAVQLAIERDAQPHLWTWHIMGIATWIAPFGACITVAGWAIGSILRRLGSAPGRSKDEAEG